MESLLFQVNSRDPLTYLAVAFMLGAGALVAAWIPALRASGFDSAPLCGDDALTFIAARHQQGYPIPCCRPPPLRRIAVLQPAWVNDRVVAASCRRILRLEAAATLR